MYNKSKKKKNNLLSPKIIQTIATIVICVFLISLIVQAGSLSPSASPAGTMNTLESIYNSIAGTFNSSAISASSTGSLIQNLKYISNNLSWASSSNNIYNLNSGYIGIGTSTPSYALDASGTIQMTGFRLPTGATNNYVLTSDANGAGTWQAASGGISATGTVNYIAKFSATSTLASSSIIDVSGNIAIGTSTPVSLLELYSTTSTQLTITSATSSDPILGFRTGATPATAFLMGVDQSDSNKFKIATSTIGTNDILTINQAGQIGINNSSPTEKLSVTGNISNIASTSFNPVLKATLTGFSTSNAVQVVGRYAYITNFTDDITRIVDVSNSSSPAVVGTFDPAIAGDGADPISIYVVGRYAYIANYSVYNFSEYSSFQIIDISNPASPVSISSVTVSYSGFSDIVVSGNYMYLTGYIPDKIYIYNISNPASPALMSSLTTGTDPNGLYVQGRYAYVVNKTSNTMQVIDISNPSSPAVSGSVNTSSTPEKVFVSGRYAYVANSGDNNLQIFDVKNPASPVFAGSIATVDAKSVFVSGRYAYITNYSGNTLEVIDVSIPSTPVSVGSATTNAGPISIFVSGRYVYVVNDTASSFQIFDISGLETTSAMIHSLEAGSLQVRENVFIANNLSVGGGINIGTGGLFSAGDVGIKGTLMVNGTSTANIILAGPGNDTVSTSTSPAIRRTTAATLAIDSPAGIIMTIDADNNDTSRVFVIRSNASSTNLFKMSETGRVDITSTASSTVYVGSATASGCLVLGDTDNAGLTYLTTLDGVLSATSTQPSICQ